MTLDVVYCAWNRLDFTRRTFAWLVAHTDWEPVDRLIVYDDGSTDGTRQWLTTAAAEAAWRTGHKLVVVHQTELGSPVAVMRHYLQHGPAEWFVKVDNDVALPPGWLGALLEASAAAPVADLIGFEAGMTAIPPREGVSYTVIASTHIGGVGLMRSAAFEGKLRGLRPRRRYYGFTEWQMENRDVERGWVSPDLASPLLDRVPIEPYATLSKSYVRLGWQREWPAYDDVWMRWAFDWLPEATDAADAPLAPRGAAA